MIEVASQLIPQSRPKWLLESVQTADQLFPGELAKIRSRLQRLVGGVDVGLVMFGVMNLHRARVEVRLQGVIGESHGRQRKRLDIRAKGWGDQFALGRTSHGADRRESYESGSGADRFQS
jgi:hypothetical protein